MCEITISHLQNNYLNRKMFLLLSTMGSRDHSDGWGFLDSSGAGTKCGAPMYCMTRVGELLGEGIDKNSEQPFLGHIRKASPLVPVSTENAHPFTLENITFVHNGKLTPKVEKDFIMETSVPEIDTNGNQLYDIKTGQPSYKMVKRSDSLIFFEKFVEIWKTKALPGMIMDEVFVQTLQETMNLFYGKFAMVFVINHVMYIARGKTADLHISYLKESEELDSRILGWVVNTSKLNLLSGTNLISNLQQLDGKNSLNFTYPALLQENTVFRADYLDLVSIGKVEENTGPASAATYSTQYSRWEDVEWEKDYDEDSGANSHVTSNVKKPVKTELEDLTEEIYQFCVSYSLSPQDIFYLMYVTYTNSSTEMTETQIRHFVKQVLPKLRNFVSKETRKTVKKSVSRYVPLYKYNSNVQYPWIMNVRENQLKFLDSN